ncbi:hypothetical protein MHU86_8579 [Fragilaria crotonensis]|nr:hypothetical protein MHU86_8579 [Fragilaria crotonensis]
MENRLAPANVDAGDLPSGFSIADPSGTSVSAEQDSQALQRQAQKDAILQQALTPDALERLRRIKLVKAEKATAVENLISSMAIQGKLPGRINEGRLIEMLEGLGARQSSSSNSKINIQRKQYAFDSDDDDNDDDLM